MNDITRFFGYLDPNGDNLPPPNESDFLEIEAERVLKFSKLLVSCAKNYLIKAAVANIRFPDD